MKLTAKSAEVFELVKENGKVSIAELAATLGRGERSIGANVLDLQKKGLAIREKVAAENEDEKDITYVILTDEGKAFVPSEDDED